MKKIVLSLLAFLMLQLCFSQNTLTWQGYFSYFEIKDLASSTNTIIAATDNSLFTKNNSTNELKTTTTLDGLPGESITAVYHSDTLNKTIIGYDTGLLIIIDQSNGKTTRIVDIVQKQLNTSQKKINHFMESQEILYISCDFGIVQFNLKTLFFGDTYFIGANGTETSIKQTAIFNGFIYAASPNGIQKANLSSKTLIDYNQWPVVAVDNFLAVESIGTQLIAVNTTGNSYKLTADTFVSFNNLNQRIVDVRTSNDNLIIASTSTVYIYDKNLTQIRQITNAQIESTALQISCASIIGDKINIGTKDNGLFTTNLNNTTVFENNTPLGPLRNNVFAIDVSQNSLWAVYGDYDLFYNPYAGGLKTFGISKYSTAGWLNIPYSKVIGARSMSRIIINPSNENQVYASSFFSGLLKIENNEPTFLFNEKNSGLETLTFVGPDYIDVRINGSAYDKSGNLWVNNSLVRNGLKVLKTNGEWQSYSTFGVTNNSDRVSFGRITIDKNDVKWIASDNSGLLAFSEKTNVFKKIGVGENTGNLPSDYVVATAVDKNNQLWIGTLSGLRVLSNVNNYQTESQLNTKPIIILEDGLAQELLFEQGIADIVVDGANNKWIATFDSGVFLVSPDGQKTIYHFTKDNSPLPSNTINDIAINDSTGEVFMATIKGMISFKGLATKANDNLNNAFVYPNPVRPEYEGTVKISGLIDKANVKITDIEGNLVFETTTSGGTIEWDTTAFGKYKVASGVYMIFISAEDGIETKVKKVMIIR